ncbi:acyl-CoA thioesterase domain-containing protein [Kineosporia sp. NBRC 101731]|uniref:acyl-CoA thioesterase n=1 Tax=Kineosporia sp. NBRC 101731 TaxID=3032199 RepID=UPI0024A14082|nr:acyl-CoA thioesterase domain-containing protein [Kineosporia sp. NBRC 101731]GLY31036.1 acyl-CoA thioesterase II [Kineosporia sp. NBRC 101731]
MTTSQTLTDVLTLEPVTAQVFDDAFEGVTGPCPWPKAYGGDLVAQAAVAAVRTTGEDRSLHSMHSYFLRPADIGRAVRYEVERLRDGRGYSTRQVRAYQNGKVVYTALASFHTGEPGPEYTASPPADVPDPHVLPPAASTLEGLDDPEVRAYWSSGRSFDLRHVPGPVYLRVDGERQPHQAVWVRPFDTLREVPGLSAAQRNTAALAYVCDYTILEPVLRVLGLSWRQPGLVTASLDHAMWFHRSAGPHDWLLYAQEAVTAHSGRGLGLGRFFTPDGTHLATVAQEGLVRI